MKLHVLRSNAQRLCDGTLQVRGGLRSCPHFHAFPAVFYPGHGIQRLELSVVNKFCAVLGLVDFGRAAECGNGVARVLHNRSGFAEVARNGRLLFHRAVAVKFTLSNFAPGDFQRAFRGQRRFVGPRRNRHTIGRQLHYLQHIPHFGNFRIVYRNRRGSQNGSAHDGGIHHVREPNVDAVLRRAIGLGRNIHAGNIMTDQPELARVLKIIFRNTGQCLWHRSEAGNLSVAEPPSGLGVDNHARFRSEFRHGNVEAVRGRIQQHAPRLRAVKTHVLVICHHRGAGRRDHHSEKEGKWISVQIVVRRAELDGHFVPVGIQFFGKDHRQRRHRALSHLRRRSHNSDAAIRSDAHPCRLQAGARSVFVHFRARADSRFEIEAKDQAKPAHANAHEEVTTLQGEIAHVGGTSNGLGIV